MQVIAIDLVLAGDNAIVIGLAAAGLPSDQRKRAILVGIIAATVLRIGFALIITWLLQIGPILLIAGGLLLLWVCWKMWREMRVSHGRRKSATEALSDSDYDKDGTIGKGAAQDLCPGRLADRHRRRLDVARQRAGRGRRRDGHPTVLIIGLACRSR